MLWQEIELRVYPDPLLPSWKISTIKKNSRSKTPLNPKTPFKWVFMDIVPDISSKRLAQDTNFSNCLLIVDAYSKLPRLHGMWKLLLKESWTRYACSKIDLEKYMNLADGIWRTFKLTLSNSLPPISFKKVFLYMEYDLHYRHRTIRQWISKLKWHVGHCKLPHNQLWCTHRIFCEYINFALMYTTQNIFTVLPIKHLIKHDGEPTTLQKLETGTKPSV